MAHITDILKYEGDNSTFIWKTLARILTVSRS